MKILLSAYACEPDKGSEPGVGWNWAIELARVGHEVYVLTRANNQRSISAELEKRPWDNLHFVYYDLPDWLKWWKKGGRGVHLYYLLWQIGVFRIARSLVKATSFDVVHHVTFVSARQPSFLGLLGIPFIFGPVAGGERAPMPLRKSFPWRGWLTDALRDVVNSWARFSPLMRLTFQSAQTIYVTSEQSRRLVPKRYHGKTAVKLAIGSDNFSLQKRKPLDREPLDEEDFPRVLYVGQLLYWKGVHFALRAFAFQLQHFPSSKLTILGKGPDELWLKKLATQLGIDAAVEWLDWLPQSEVNKVYQSHQVLLFPSLHDSGGMVVLEAMNNGLPVICLDLGGPGVTVNDTCGYKIKTSGRTEAEVVDDLRKTLVVFFESSRRRNQLAEGALKRANDMGWASLVKTVYCDSRTLLLNSRNRGPEPPLRLDE